MKILKSVQKIPGGLMAVPLLIGTLINTLFPHALQIGGFTTGLFTGSSALMGLFLVCSGASIRFNQVGIPLYKGVALTLIKLLLGVSVGWVVQRAFGREGILGLTPFVLIAALTNSNGAIYTTLASQYGDATDVGAISILSLNDGPFFTMIALGATGLAEIPFMSLVAAIIPILVGFILGNLDEDIRKLLENSVTMVIPFCAFALGGSMNLVTIVQAGFSGILLGLLVVVITGFGGFLLYNVLLRRKGCIGAAVGTTAGNAIATPAAVAAADSSLAPFAAAASTQIAAAVIITALLCPVLVAILNRYRENGVAETV